MHKNRLEPWDCHEHKDEMFVCNKVVCHPEHGQLCFLSTTFQNSGKYTVSSPIEFNTEAAAQKWIDSGCIGEIQESLNYLHVGFTNVMVKYIPSFTDWLDAL